MAREGQNHSIDLNKTPSPSSQSEGGNDHLEQQFYNETETNTPEQVSQKKKRRPYKKYNFLPETTNMEKKRAYAKSFYAEMSSEDKAKRLNKSKENRQRLENKVTASIKSRARYEKLSKTEKYKLNQKIIKVRRERIAKLSVEEREKRRLEYNARERERQGRKRAEKRAKKGLFTFASCVSIDLNKSPPPEDDYDIQQVENNQVKSSAISNKPESLNLIRKRKNTFIRTKNTNWEKMPTLGKAIKCKHSKNCIHWETLTKAEKHIVRNREYRQNNPSAREREKAQKKELYQSFSKAQRKELSNTTARNRKKRIAQMNDKELLEYNNKRAKWQRESYAKKMQTATPEQIREFKDKRKKDNKRWREKKNKGPFLWDLNEEASPEHDVTEVGHVQDQNTVEQSSINVSPNDHTGVTGRRSTLNRPKRIDLRGLKSIINCDIHHKGCIHWDKLTKAEKGYQYTKMKRLYDPEFKERERAFKRKRYSNMTTEKKKVPNATRSQK